ncbi:MAG: hypothetical protein N4A35_00300 [Flavobacteriales bacterium]|jgi:hypothetical protein|nr:hypothetical protein [Flavobacteriales bacterium]
MKKIGLFFLLAPIIIYTQKKPLDIFKPLVNHTWHAEGKWNNGSQFKQEITFDFSLKDKLVKVQTLGYTNAQQTEYGLRNEGIRQYDPKSKEIKFWEYDVFGGITEGVVIAQEKDLIYKYTYGGTSVTEMWVYKNEFSYNYIVGIYTDDKWQQKFLETEFKRKID